MLGRGSIQTRWFYGPLVSGTVSIFRDLLKSVDLLGNFVWTVECLEVGRSSGNHWLDGRYLLRSGSIFRDSLVGWTVKFMKVCRSSGTRRLDDV